MNTHKWPVVISFIRITLLTIHFKQILVSQTVHHFLQNNFLQTTFRNHNTNKESWRDTKTQYAIDVCSHNLQMHKSHKYLLECFHRSVFQMRSRICYLLLENHTFLIFFLPSNFIVTESPWSITFLAKCFNHIFNLVFVANQTMNTVAILIINTHIKRCSWNNHKWKSLFLFCFVLCFENIGCCCLSLFFQLLVIINITIKLIMSNKVCKNLTTMISNFL